jgi:hypothetical protein
MKIAVFWDMTPCSLVDINVSGELAASIFRAEILFSLLPERNFR